MIFSLVFNVFGPTPFFPVWALLFFFWSPEGHFGGGREITQAHPTAGGEGISSRAFRPVFRAILVAGDIFEFKKGFK